MHKAGLQKLVDPDDPVRDDPAHSRSSENNFVGELERLRANIYLPMKQASSSTTTCPIYMTEVALSQKKVPDNFYLIPADCG